MGFLTTLKDFFSTSRSIENPSTPLSAPDDWLLDLAGGATSSGVAVTPQTALQYAPVWRAISLISKDVAKLPLVVYRRAGTGKDKATAHPAYRLLRYQASTSMSAFEFKQTLTADALIYGNGYAAIIRNNAGTATELIPLSAGATNEIWQGNKRHYVTVIDNKEERISAEDMLHIRGLYGLSIVELARESLGLGIAAEKYGAVFFKNNAKPSAILEHPGHLDPDARDNLRKSWNSLHGRVENAHKIAILEEGMSLKNWSMSNEEAQYLKTREFEVKSIASWFGVPPHKLGDSSRTAYNSLEQENQSYLNEALDPWLIAWENECRAKLLSESQKARDSHIVEFNRLSLVRADLKSRAAFYKDAINGGWMSRDEIRSRENMNPIEDGTGADFLVPLNMGKAPIKIEDSPESDAEFGARSNPEELRFYLTDILQATIRRMAGRLAIKAGKKAKEAASSQKPEILSRWLDEGMQAENQDVVGEALDPVLEALGVVKHEDPEKRRDHIGEFFRFMRASLSVISDADSRNEIAGEAVNELSSRWLGDN